MSTGPSQEGPSPDRDLPLQGRSKLQHRRIGAGLQVPRGRQQRLEPARLPGPDPAVQALPRASDTCPGRHAHINTVWIELALIAADLLALAQ